MSGEGNTFGVWRVTRFYVPLMLQAVRARVEGIAAIRKRPSAVMAGQIAYLLSLVAALAVTLHFGVMGWKMAVIGIYTATLSTIAVVYVALTSQRR